MPDRPPPSLVPAGPRYREQDWDGHQLYTCEHCPFDTFSLGNMHQHQELGCRPPDGEWEQDE